MRWIRSLLGVLALACVGVLVLPDASDAQVVCGPMGCYRIKPARVKYYPSPAASMQMATAYSAPRVAYPPASYGYAPSYSYSAPATYSAAYYSSPNCSTPKSYQYAPPVQYDAPPLSYSEPSYATYYGASNCSGPKMQEYAPPRTYGAPNCSGGGGGPVSPYGATSMAMIDYSYGY